MQHLITLVCLVAAIVLYYASLYYDSGFRFAAAVFITAGMVFEGIFWMRLFRKRCQ